MFESNNVEKSRMRLQRTDLRERYLAGNAERKASAFDTSIGASKRRKNTTITTHVSLQLY